MTDTATDLLTQVDGIGPERAAALLAALGTGNEVAKASVHGWIAIARVDGFSEDTARDFYRDLVDAGVYDDLKQCGGE